MKKILTIFFFVFVGFVYPNAQGMNTEYNGPGADSKIRYLSDFSNFESLIPFCLENEKSPNRKTLPESLTELAKNMRLINKKNLPSEEKIRVEELYRPAIGILISSIEKLWVSIRPQDIDFVQSLAIALKNVVGYESPQETRYLTDPANYFFSKAPYDSSEENRPVFLLNQKKKSIGNTWVSLIEELATKENLADAEQYAAKLEKLLKEIDLTATIPLKEQLFIIYGCTLLQEFELQNAYEKGDKLVYFLCAAQEKNKTIRQNLTRLMQEGKKLVTAYAQDLFDFHLTASEAFKKMLEKHQTSEVFLKKYALDVFLMVTKNQTFAEKLKDATSCEYQLVTSIPSRMLADSLFEENFFNDLIRLTGAVEPIIFSIETNASTKSANEKKLVEACNKIMEEMKILSTEDWSNFNVVPIYEGLETIKNNFKTFVSPETLKLITSIDLALANFKDDIIKLSLLMNTQLSLNGIISLSIMDTSILKNFCIVRERKLIPNNSPNILPEDPQKQCPKKENPFLKALQKRTQQPLNQEINQQPASLIKEQIAPLSQPGSITQQQPINQQPTSLIKEQKEQQPQPEIKQPNTPITPLTESSSTSKPSYAWLNLLKNRYFIIGATLGGTLLISSCIIAIFLQQKVAQPLIQRYGYAATPLARFLIPDLVAHNLNIGTNQTQFLVKPLVTT